MPDSDPILEHGGVVVGHDSAATARAYGLIETGGPEECGCGHCLNWVKAREAVYDPPMKALLNGLGIDRAKEGEVYYCGGGKREPCLYGGYFHFIGRIIERSGGHGRHVQLPGSAFQICLREASAPRLRSFEAAEAVELTFWVNAPWLLMQDAPE